jgi:hypothetical protein
MKLSKPGYLVGSWAIRRGIIESGVAAYAQCSADVTGPSMAEGMAATDVEVRLLNAGFAVVPGIVCGDQLRRLAIAYDVAVGGATSPNLRVGSDTTRVHGLMNADEDFVRLSIHPQVLAACRCLIRGQFRLGSLLARTVRPRSRAQPLHVDAAADADGWPMVGFIVMVDAFEVDNGATRFVPGSHGRPRPPVEEEASAVLALGVAGSLVVYNGSVWHGHSANQTDTPRRSVQGAYVRTSPPQ